MLPILIKTLGVWTKRSVYKLLQTGSEKYIDPIKAIDNQFKCKSKEQDGPMFLKIIRKSILDWLTLSKVIHYKTPPNELKARFTLSFSNL